MSSAPSLASALPPSPFLSPSPAPTPTPPGGRPPGLQAGERDEPWTRLHAQVQEIVAARRPAGAPWPTGLAALDAALGGGIQRGRITELVGPLAVGKTTLLRHVVAHALATGAWVAWIDAGRTLAPAPWADLGERFVVIRLPERKRAAWTADLLLRSGVFGLVVLDGAPPLSRSQGVRLAQLARERDAACVVVEHLIPGQLRGQRLAGTIRVRVGLSTPPSMRAPSTRSGPPPARSHPRTEITVEKGAVLTRSQPIEVDRVVVLARRVCTHSEVPDRRGVARGPRHAWSAGGSAGSNGSPVESPVTWGGLGVGSHDLYGTDLPGHPARLAAGLDEPGDRLGDDPRQLQQELDRRTRDWATYRGRRRAAESGFGRRGRRELARERTGALLTGGGGQSAPRQDRADLAPPPTLG